MTQAEYPRHAFVVRIWREAGLPWRGWVQHAGTQEQRYVQNVEELLSFLHDHTAGLVACREVNGNEQGGEHA